MRRRTSLACFSAVIDDIFPDRETGDLEQAVEKPVSVSEKRTGPGSPAERQEHLCR